MATITLYQFEECPYCMKVRAKLAEMKLEYEKVNVPRDREDPLRKDLLEKSGVPTVPVIKIDDRYIGDSSAIVAYLEKKF
ncbi:TPA: glutaredoxin [Candidatus Woesearchaeota archaeon]|nr:glutaredoxin [archaeon]HIJ11180.1 glutaredoxin [Candidatus Woesearchaeota archaeon]